MRTPFLCVLIAGASLAAEPPPTTFAEYEARHESVCNGPLERLAAPEVKEHGGYRYELSGAVAKIRRATPRKGAGPLKIGVLSAIKDTEPETRAALDGFFAEFERQDVEVVVLGGDTAEEAGALNDAYEWLVTKTRRPLVTISGNSERPAAHNYAVGRQRKAGHEHLVNMVVVRRLDLDGADLVSLSGYYDKAFLHMRGACVYEQKDVDAVVAAAKEADDPVVLLMHGPPRQKGKDAIDFVPDSGNVGDPAINAAIVAAKIPFGIHGHILEAGARATDLAGRPLKPGAPHPALFLNPGSANPLPWKLNGGGTSYGVAAVLTVEGKKARYEILRAEKPAPKKAE